MDDDANLPSTTNANKFAITEWNPKSPLDYLSLLRPTGTLSQKESLEADYEERQHTGKIPVASKRRQRRLSDNLSGRYIYKKSADERQLFSAVETDDPTLVDKLLESGVDPSATDVKSRTPLHIAASKGNRPMVKLLLSYGADPNKCDTVGNTPLHLASCTSKVDIVTDLLSAGTSVDAADHCGRTPLTLARSKLKVLYKDRGCSSDRLKVEVLKIIDMMTAYLNLLRRHDDVAQLDSLCVQLGTLQTRDEMDNLGELLEDFTDIAISNRHRGIT